MAHRQQTLRLYHFFPSKTCRSPSVRIIDEKLLIQNTLYILLLLILLYLRKFLVNNTSSLFLVLFYIIFLKETQQGNNRVVVSTLDCAFCSAKVSSFCVTNFPQCDICCEVY